MELKSTLQRNSEKMEADHKRLVAGGMSMPPKVITINEMIRNSPQFSYTFKECIETVKTIQPSIGEDDLQIAVCMELTLCSQLIYNLIEAELIKIVE